MGSRVRPTLPMGSRNISLAGLRPDCVHTEVERSSICSNLSWQGLLVLRYCNLLRNSDEKQRRRLDVFA